MARPVAIGPTSRTVIGAVTTDPAPAAPKKKVDWKRFAIPAGLIGAAVYITMRYKGHV